MSDTYKHKVRRKARRGKGPWPTDYQRSSGHNHMRRCGCRVCQAGLHYPAHKKDIDQAIGGDRRRWKAALSKTDEPQVDAPYIAYTD